jgi:hypothetical protein
MSSEQVEWMTSLDSKMYYGTAEDKGWHGPFNMYERTTGHSHSGRSSRHHA